MTLLLLAVSQTAWGLASPQSGPYLDLAAGFGSGGRPLAPGVGWHVAPGWWMGKYDKEYALGRYWSVGPALRGDWTGPDDPLRTAVMLDVRRGMDLLVAGLHGSLATGVVLGGPDLLLTARAGFGAKWRRSRWWGITLRVEAGADFTLEGDVGATAAVLIGGSYARPKKKKKKD